MALFLFDSDFNGPFNDAPPDPYYDDIGIGYIDPFLIYVLLAVVATVVIAVSLGAYIGRRQAAMRLDEAKRRSVDHIYGSIRYRIDQALQARGLGIIERAAFVREEIYNRLGHVMALVDKPGKALGELQKALPAEAEAEKPKPPKVKIAMSAEEQMIAVWESLNALRLFWSNEDYVKGLLRAAQDELARTDSLAYVRQLEAQYMPPDTVNWRPTWPMGRKISAETIVTDALNDADKAGSAVVVPVVETTPVPPPEPDPTPPGPRSPSLKNLPAHKRNMLA